VGRTTDIQRASRVELCIRKSAYDGGAKVAKVTLFSTPSCSWCKRAKRHLREKRVRFKEVDIERDPRAAQDLVKKTGRRAYRL